MGDEVVDATRKRKSEKKAVITGPGPIPNVQDLDQPSGKEKKRRKKNVDADSAVTEIIGDKSSGHEDGTNGATGEVKPELGHGKKDKKKSRKKHDKDGVEVNAERGTSAKGDDEGNLDDDALREANMVEEGAVPKKKKSKRCHSFDVSPVDKAAESQGPVNKKRKKSKSNGTEFKDPSEDESLPEQARKALIYAYTQFQYPETWKFNKARQNWLIRNIWSEQSIPEAYLPLTIQYLAGVKGGIREALIQACKTLISENQPKQEAADDPQCNGSTVMGTSTKDVKHIRAQSLLDTLQSPANG